MGAMGFKNDQLGLAMVLNICYLAFEYLSQNKDFDQNNYCMRKCRTKEKVNDTNLAATST